MTVRVDVPEPPGVRPTLVGLRLWVRLEGETVVDREIVPENPPRLARVTVDVPEDPRLMVRVLGLEDSVKSCTFTVIETECKIVPSVPLMVTV